LRELSNMTYSDDPEVDLDGIEALAAAAGLPVEEYLQAAAAQARRTNRPRTGSSLYQRIQYAGGLRRLVDKLYPRVLADPSLMFYFKHLSERDLHWLRWHMLTLLAVLVGGPSRYQGRDLHEVHADLHITGEAFDRVAWHLQGTLQELEIQQEDQQTILAAVQARRDEVVTFEEG
jgi:hemoglobin